MKKLLLVLVILVSIMLLAGCDGVIPPPPPDDVPPLALIRKYTGTDIVVRWPDGVVSVYDGTNCEWVGDILDEINVATGGTVVFKPSEDPNSQIKIIFEDLTGTGMGQAKIDVESNDDEIFNVDIEIDPLIGVEQPLYMMLLLNSVGIDLWESVVGLTQEMKTVIYWLYQLNPGYPLV